MADWNTNRPRQIAVRYHNENLFAGNVNPTTASGYSETSPEITIVQETQTLDMNVWSATTGIFDGKKTYFIEITAEFLGRNNGTPQIWEVNIANLPGFSAGFNLASDYTDIFCPVQQGTNVLVGKIGFSGITRIRFECPNSGANTTKMNWKFTFVQ